MCELAVGERQDLEHDIDSDSDLMKQLLTPN
jgi:hypothetical protein